MRRKSEINLQLRDGVQQQAVKWKQNGFVHNFTIINASFAHQY